MPRWFLARNKPGSQEYVLSRNPLKPAHDRIWYGEDAEAISAELWHALGGVRLKPGEGPVRIVPPRGKWRRVK
jgi:hypothetical protein